MATKQTETAEPEVEQGSFLDALGKPPRYTDKDIQVSRIDDANGVEPTIDFVQSIDRFGVLVPILVERAGNGRYKLIDGRRRVAAARLSEIATIPARIVTGDSALLPDVLTLQANNQRSANAVAELQAMERLIEQDATERDLVQATGLSVQAIRKRLRLRSLIAPLRKAWEKGKISTSTAEAVARLDTARQKDCAATLKSTGKLRGKDVHEVREVKSAAAVDSLDDDIFSPPETGSWQEQVRLFVDGALAAADGQEGTGPLVKALQKARDLTETA